MATEDALEGRRERIALWDKARGVSGGSSECAVVSGLLAANKAHSIKVSIAGHTFLGPTGPRDDFLRLPMVDSRE